MAKKRNIRIVKSHDAQKKNRKNMKTMSAGWFPMQTSLRFCLPSLL